ncbi:hypothetical protein C5167_026500 [Papaver somniferum]|nr:hypothetical protein C5167_026500 [Papaver somniferum]
MHQRVRLLYIFMVMEGKQVLVPCRRPRIKEHSRIQELIEISIEQNTLQELPTNLSIAKQSRNGWCGLVVARRWIGGTLFLLDLCNRLYGKEVMYGDRK